MNNVFNRQKKLDVSISLVHLLFLQKFKLDSTISSLYQSEGIRGMAEKYVFSNKGDYMLKKDNLSLNEINSVSFYFFINQFIRQNDDYNASIYFKKLSSVLNNIDSD